MSNINFKFISSLEGGQVCTAYVPDPEHSKSGVTIATGFDLGQRSYEELTQLLPKNIAEKLKPYCLLKSKAAEDYLKQNPLTVSETKAQIIDLCVKSQMIELLESRYNAQSTKAFNQLPEHAQTVIASVAFQYGNLQKRCPKFWFYATNQHWKGMINELYNFGDRYKNRRFQEANYFINKGK